MALKLRVQSGEATVEGAVDTALNALLVARVLLQHGADAVSVEPETGDPYQGTRQGNATARSGLPEFPVDHAELLGSLEPAAAQLEAAHGAYQLSGDVGDDITQALTTADQWLDTNLFGTPEGKELIKAVPYGSLLTEAHELRYQALHGEPSKGATPSPTSPPPPGPSSWPAAWGPQPGIMRPEIAARVNEAALRSVLMEAQNTTRSARKGDARAIGRIVTLKERAARGDKEARRLFKIYNLVADEDQRAIDEAASQ